MSAATMIGPVLKPTDWGFPGHLTQQEFDVLVEFRKATAGALFPKGKMMEDKDLLRFLRARDFSHTKAFDMLKHDLEWRKEFENITFKRADCPAILKFLENGALYRAGTDLDGRPIIVVKFAKLYPRDIQDASEITKFWVSYVGYLITESEKMGMVDYTIIGDLAGFSPSKNFSLAYVRVLLEILQLHYPERLGLALVVNVPFTFRAVWNLIAPFIEERTKAKIHLLGGSASALKALQTYVAKDVLEAYFEGSHADYPKPDHIAKLFDGEGITVQCGYFDDESSASSSPASKSSKAQLGRKMSDSRMKRIREMMSNNRVMSSFRAAVGGSSSSNVKTKDVPKSAPRLALFGGTGKTGIEVAKRAFEAGYDVACFVRLEGGKGIPPAMVKMQQSNPDRFQIVIGDIHDPNDLDRVIETSDVVVSCIGAPKSVSGEFFTKTAAAICDAMERNGTRRLVVVTAAQSKRMSKAWIDRSASILDNIDRALYWEQFYKYIGDMEKLIEGNKETVDWTFVRPAALADGGAENDYRIELDSFWCGANPVPRVALANFIVKECIGETVGKKFIGKGVAIAGGKE